MRESYNEELAIHIGPESCVDCGDTIGEALTGEDAGWVLSPEIDLTPCADAFQVCGRQHFVDRNGKGCKDTAGSQTPCMHGSTLNGNREALYPILVDCAKVRMDNPQGEQP